MALVVGFIKLKLFVTGCLLIKVFKRAYGIACYQILGRRYVVKVPGVIYTCSEYNTYQTSNENISKVFILMWELHVHLIYGDFWIWHRQQFYNAAEGVWSDVN